MDGWVDFIDPYYNQTEQNYLISAIVTTTKFTHLTINEN